ncbi:hypothetical protein PL586_01395 [Phocaeicola vulgatus]|nr:hypothetical protein [Phocaeicola vulgatus]
MLFLIACKTENQVAIDRESLVRRNNPHITAFDSLSSLSVGNGEFAITVDATGLQTFPDVYKEGVPLGTQSQWGWHSFINKEHYRHEETLQEYDFGRGKLEPYAAQSKAEGRKKNAENWFRANPHRLHLGIVGLELPKEIRPSDLENVNQELDMWNGIIHSCFQMADQTVKVTTACHPHNDMIVAKTVSSLKTGIKFHFPYPTGEWGGDACDWTKNDLHTTTIVKHSSQSVTLERKIDNTIYYVIVNWEGKAGFSEKEKNYFVLLPEEDSLAFTCSFVKQIPENTCQDYATLMKEVSSHWNSYWKEGAVVDFSACKDIRARELERRVVLSQYLLAIQCAGSVPPQETGLTYNSWFGKFHLEMIWWHQAHFALWGHSDLLEHTLSWYHEVYPVAKEIAERQGFKGIRWMKMTDPSGMEAPSKVGSFLIWQQPHLIYLAELLYRANPSDELLQKYNKLVQETAEFMYSFAAYDEKNDRYILKGAIPAQETLKAEVTFNSPYELAYWHCAMQLAQKWRERMDEKRSPEWDTLIDKLSVLAAKDELYLAAESAIDTYQNIDMTSDHMAVLGALGIFPESRLVDKEIMRNTLHWVWDNWNWDHTWGWDYPMTAMNATRLGEPEKAIGALLMDKRTNTYLVSGHNYQNERLRIYLPGNGGLLTAIAMMCAGWDGCNISNPGFPKDGNWDVKWEGLLPMP